MYSEKISMFSDRDGGWVRKFQSEPREETSVGWKTLENRTHIDRYHIHIIYIYDIVFMKYHKEWEKDILDVSGLDGSGNQSPHPQT